MKIQTASPPPKTPLPTPSSPSPANAQADKVSLGATPEIERATGMQKLVAYSGLACTAATVAGLVTTGAFASLGSSALMAGACLGAFFAADIGTGLVHHFLDNVRPDKLPKWLEKHAHDFQNHHHNPRDVVHREYCNHTAGTQVFTTPILAGLALTSWTLPALAPLTAGLAVFANCANLAQEFHRRSHMTDAENPAIVKWCQKAGIMVPKKVHAAHHGTGHNSNYALLNGVTNKLLDDFKFRLTPSGPKTNILRKLEVGLYRWQGCDPNAWGETPGLKEYALTGQNPPNSKV